MLPAVFVDEELARRLELHEALFAGLIAEAFAAADPSCGATFRHVAGATAAWVAPGSVLSKVHGLGFDQVVTDKDLDVIEDFYRARGETRVAIEMSPFAGADLIARLERRGYRVAGFEQVQARPLTREDASLNGPLPAGVSIEIVEPGDRATRKAWTRVSTEGFFAPAPTPGDILR